MNEERYSVEFIIFEQSRLLLDGEVAILSKLLFKDELEKILEEACERSNDRFHLCYSDQNKLIIANKDETKLLCHYLDKWPWSCLKNEHSIKFHQKHAASESAFTVDELADICSYIQLGLEQFLGRRILYPIISTPLVTHNINPQEFTDCNLLD